MNLKHTHTHTLPPSSTDYTQYTPAYQEKGRGGDGMERRVNRRGVLPGPTFRYRGYQQEKQREKQRGSLLALFYLEGH